MKLKRIVREGQMLPAWYFGNSYRDPARCEMVMHIIPINYLIRVGRQIQHWWNRYKVNFRANKI
jgi:hypothetical protein